MSRLRFRLEGQSAGTRARATTFTTLHGEVRTPVFMPVGTQATVRAQTVEALAAAGSQVLLANTYHLLLRPGPEVFRRLGGIHRFMNWSGPVLTDSGGFQIFSLPHSRRMNEEGAVFRSYIDQRDVLLTPEISIGTQKAIGSDIMMVLDECVPSTCERGVAEAAMHRTHRWAKRSLEARGDSEQALFGIVQGACFEDLRRQSADVLREMPFDGFAVGGLAVGESRAEREDFTELTAALLPEDRPRYLMGVGTPIDLLEAVHRGVDLFDCILPVALAQQGVAYTSKGELRLRRTVFRFSEERLDPACPCPTCAKYSRAYLHHLIKADEILGWQLIAAHNLHFYHRLMAGMREAVLENRFLEFYRERKPLLEMKDEENPVTPPRRNRKRDRHPKRLGDYEIVLSPEGGRAASIRQLRSGEIMHSVNDPELEARRLYVEQSGLEARLLADPAAGELVIWDVGLGAATNAMAAVRLAESLAGRPARALHLVSFENDLDSLRLVLKNPGYFPHIRHGAPHALLESSEWASVDGRIRWTLLEGDFLERMGEVPAPDVVFYDPFSYKTDSPLWSIECFRRLEAAWSAKAASLYTYSASTAVRAALLASGFFVAAGVGTGPKAETTIALNRRALVDAGAVPSRERLLSGPWLGKWERSGARVPQGFTAEQAAEFERLIREHEQFRALLTGGMR